MRASRPGKSILLAILSTYRAAAILAAVLALCTTAVTAAPRDITLPPLNPTLEQIPTQAAGLVSAWRSSQGFPTLTVVEVAGEFRPDESTQDETLQSYQESGILDAEVTSGNKISASRYQVVVRYTDSKSEYRTLVTYIQARDSYFILTWLDNAERFTNSKQRGAEIAQQTAVTGEHPPTSGSSDISFALILCAATILGSAVFTILLFKIAKKYNQKAS